MQISLTIDPPAGMTDKEFTETVSLALGWGPGAESGPMDFINHHIGRDIRQRLRQGRAMIRREQDAEPVLPPRPKGVPEAAGKGPPPGL